MCRRREESDGADSRPTTAQLILLLFSCCRSGNTRTVVDEDEDEAEEGEGEAT